MRIVELAIERYGAVEALALDLGGPGLVVIHGPNEAGKSTTLSAVTDLLFGIHTTAMASRYGADAICIRALLRFEDGREIRLVRRKGRGRNSLVDGTGAPLDEGVLPAALGSTGRERFGRLFGLGHEALREGGERLLAADGDIGRVIVEAGGGLRGTVERLDGLDAELDGLFSPRRSGQRAFYQALDGFARAEEAARAGLLSREDWERCRRAHGKARDALENLREERRHLVERIAFLERLMRTGPLVAELKGVEAAIDELSGLPDAAEGFPARWLAVKEARGRSRDAYAEILGERRELEARLSALEPDPRVGEALGEIRAVLESARKTAIEDEARAEIVAMAHAATTRVEASRAILGERPSPGPGAVGRVRAFARDALARHAAIVQAERSLADSIRSAEAAAASLSLHAGAEGVAGDDAAIDPASFVGLPDRLAEIDGKAERIMRERADLDRRLVRLGMELAWLRDLDCPDSTAVAEEARRRDARGAEAAAATGSRKQAAAEAEAALRDVDRLLAAGAGVAADEVRSARAAREQAWRPVRDAVVHGSRMPVGQEGVRVLEERVVAADRLADMFAQGTGRAAELSEARRRRSEAVLRENGFRELEGDAARETAAGSARFAELYPEFVATCRHDLGRMRSFLSERASLLEAASRLDAAEAEIAQARNSCEPAFALLVEVERMTGLDPRAVVPVRARKAAAVLDDRRRRREAAAQVRAQAERTAAQAGDAHARVDELRSEDAEARVRVADDLSALGLPVDVEPRRAAEHVDLWVERRAAEMDLDVARRRLEQMDLGTRILRDRVDSLLGRLGLGQVERSVAPTILRHLERSHAESCARRDELVPRKAALDLRLATREQARDEAEAAVSRLTAELGGEPSEAMVDSLLPDLARRDLLSDERRGLLARLLAAGGGIDAPRLRAECEGLKPDVVAGELAAARDAVPLLDGQIEGAVEAEHEKRADMRERFARAEAGSASAERECAIAGMHEILERYVEARLARDLVAQAIAAVRRECQAPIVARAGSLFAQATGGSFDGLDTEVDAAGRPVVVGRRPSGEQVRIAEMSEGTRDQLFLTFRLSAVEAYCRAAEPLPLVLDDVLVHADDLRAGRLLEMLALVGRSTQVLLMTHHGTVRDAAARIADSGVARLVELER